MKKRIMLSQSDVNVLVCRKDLFIREKMNARHLLFYIISLNSLRSILFPQNDKSVK